MAVHLRKQNIYATHEGRPREVRSRLPYLASNQSFTTIDSSYLVPTAAAQLAAR